MLGVGDRKRLQKGKGYQGWGRRPGREEGRNGDLIRELCCLRPGLAHEAGAWGASEAQPSAAPATAELDLGSGGLPGVAPSPAGHSDNSVLGSVRTPPWGKLFP